jgi:hypothetical protein
VGSPSKFHDDPGNLSCNGAGAKGPGRSAHPDAKPLFGEELLGRANPKVKSFEVPKRLVAEAWEKVRAKDGARGVDRVSIAMFQSREGDLLYKLWNRMSAGSYMPSPVRAVEIPKDHGTGVRVLGVPTVTSYREVDKTRFGFVGGHASVSSAVREAA